MSFNLNWKELILIAAFLIGGVLVVANLNHTQESKTPTKPETEVLTVAHSPLMDIEEQAQRSGGGLDLPSVAQNQPANPEPITQVQSPISEVKPVEKRIQQPTTVEAVAKNEQPAEAKLPATTQKTKSAAVSNTTTAVKPKPTTETARSSTPSKIVSVTPTKVGASAKNTENALVAKSVATSTNPAAKVSGGTPPASASSTTASTPAGNYYLIAASRPTFEEAQVSFDALRREGYTPIMLSPIKSKGINNYRVAIFRATDRAKVEEYANSVNGKAKSYWIDQR